MRGRRVRSVGARSIVVQEWL